MNRRSFNYTDKRRIEELWREGKSIDDIATQLNARPETLKKLIKREGFKRTEEAQLKVDAELKKAKTEVDNLKKQLEVAESSKLYYKAEVERLSSGSRSLEDELTTLHSDASQLSHFVSTYPELFLKLALEDIDPICLDSSSQDRLRAYGDMLRKFGLLTAPKKSSWTKLEDLEITDRINAGESVSEIATKMNRSRHSLAYRAAYLRRK